jgi:allantoate deiminase
VLELLAGEVLARCDEVATFSEESGRVTRTFLCEPMKRLHGRLAGWMEAAGMNVRIDPAANLIGRHEGAREGARVFAIGSHLDTVPDAGKYDGVLGVLLGVAAVRALALLRGDRRLPFAIEVIGFSEEEGIRFRAPFLGSRAISGRFDARLLDRTDAEGITMADAFRAFGHDPARIAEAAYPAGRLLGFLEAHIEQGPVLETKGGAVGVVEAIAGQVRIWARFWGIAGHAGTLPMEARHDALAAAAEFVLEVERRARQVDGLRATVGTLTVAPGAVNVVPGEVRLSLDVRHAIDAVRDAGVADLLAKARAIAARRGLDFQVDQEEHHPAVPADRHLTELLAASVAATGHEPFRLVSGAGHDAAVMAEAAPMAMLFLRSPGGVSHHPDERVVPGDVCVALDVIVGFLERLGRDGQVGEHPGGAR